MVQYLPMLPPRQNVSVPRPDPRIHRLVVFYFVPFAKGLGLLYCSGRQLWWMVLSSVSHAPRSGFLRQRDAGITTSW